MKLEELLAKIAEGEHKGIYLVLGDLVTAEPQAVKLGEALAEAVEAQLEVRRRPESLAPILADLKTFSLFGGGKVVVAVGTALLADRRAAAQLLDEAIEVAPPRDGGLGPRERIGASRLLQVLHLFEIDPDRGGVGEVLARLPDWVLQGAGKRKRAKNRIAPLRKDLESLLEAARSAELVGRGEGDLADLGALAEGSLPPGHHLVLAESAAAADHPLVRRMADQHALLRTGSVQADRGGRWQGLEPIVRALRDETGSGITSDALQELTRRTLRKEDRSQEVVAESTARMAAEYRKLAKMASGGRITLALVEEVVVDRGQEDVWKLLDAVGEGRRDEALTRLRRMLSTTPDAARARLTFFALLADYCRQVVAVSGLLELMDLPRGMRSYPRFKSQLAGALARDLPTGGKSPVAGLHPFRLHRAYLAASRIPSERLAKLPWQVLQTELALKGESGEPDVALDTLVLALSAR